MKFINGYKTQIGLIAYGLLGIAYAQGWVDEATAGSIASVVTWWTGMSVKHSWDKKHKPMVHHTVTANLSDLADKMKKGK